MNKEQIQAVYFGYFDQLPEPWRSEAKANYIPVCPPKEATLASALIAFFDWEDSPQGFDYWNSIHEALEDGWNFLPLTPPLIKEEPELYEVACFDLDGIESVVRCDWYGNDDKEEQSISALFLISEDTEYSLSDLHLTPYAWRPVPPVTIPPRPVTNPEN